MVRNFYLSAADLMNYLYCPRIIYFVHVLKMPQFTTIKEIEGREKNLIFQKKSKRTKIVKKYPKRPKIYDVALSSDEYGFNTKADCILLNYADNEAYPLQFKNAFKPRQLFKTQRFQIIMEAILIEKNLNYRVPYGFIKFIKSGDLVKISITERHKQELEDYLAKIQQIIQTEFFPKATKYKRRCKDCCYRNMCGG